MMVQTEPAKNLTRQNDGRFSKFAADFHLNDDSPKWWTKTENVELGKMMTHLNDGRKPNPAALR